MGLPAAEMVHDGDQGTGKAGMEAPVEPEAGRVHQFILEEDIKGGLLKSAAEFGVQVIQQAHAIGAPGETDDFHPVALLPKIPDQVAVIDEAPGNGIQAAIDEQAYPH
jgi:hypothetical protein